MYRLHGKLVYLSNMVKVTHNNKDTSGLYYKHIMIIIDAASAVSK
jgi:hypothetical protein